MSSVDFYDDFEAREQLVETLLVYQDPVKGSFGARQWNAPCRHSETILLLLYFYSFFLEQLLALTDYTSFRQDALFVVASVLVVSGITKYIWEDAMSSCKTRGLFVRRANRVLTLYQWQIPLGHVGQGTERERKGVQWSIWLFARELWERCCSEFSARSIECTW